MSYQISIERRIDLLCNLGGYMRMNDTAWQNAKERAVRANAWFTIEHVDLAVENIVHRFLQRAELWISIQSAQGPAMVEWKARSLRMSTTPPVLQGKGYFLLPKFVF